MTRSSCNGASTLVLVQNHFLEFCVDLNFKLVITKKVSSSSSKQKTHDVEPRWPSDSWPTIADHHESQTRPHGAFLPESHVEVQVVEVREAHHEFSHLLNLAPFSAVHASSSTRT